MLMTESPRDVHPVHVGKYLAFLEKLQSDLVLAKVAFNRSNELLNDAQSLIKDLNDIQKVISQTLHLRMYVIMNSPQNKAV